MIVGHKKQWEFLKNNFEKGQLAHAFLFSGEEKIGKKTLAVEFIKSINCLNKNRPCENCRSCVDIKKGNYPDFLFVRAGAENSENPEFSGEISYNRGLPDLKSGEDLSSKNEIEISQARKAKEFLSLKSYYGNFKSVIIDNAEKMNIEAQNCLLKTLEEPKGNTILILISSQPERLLKTIFSRCQQIKFFPANKKEISQFLVDVGCRPKLAEELTDIADGRPGVATDFFRNPGKLEREQKILNELLKIMSQDLAEKFAYAKNLKDDGANILEIMQILQKYFRRKLLIDKSASQKLKFLNDLIYKLTFTNASPKLALEILLLEI
jgi:DNA polymerase-3 subunit delta'